MILLEFKIVHIVTKLLLFQLARKWQRQFYIIQNLIQFYNIFFINFCGKNCVGKDKLS